MGSGGVVALTRRPNGKDRSLLWVGICKFGAYWTVSISLTRFEVKHRHLSFFSAREMRARIENLPSPPRWKAVEVNIEGGVTKDPLTLYYRDGLECFKFLFGNPLFVDHMEYIPRR